MFVRMLISFANGAHGSSCAAASLLSANKGGSLLVDSPHALWYTVSLTSAPMPANIQCSFRAMQTRAGVVLYLAI